jgi:hypothetical protein
MLPLGMTKRMTLKRGDLAHLLASSLYEHVGLLRDPASKGKLRVSRDACYEVAKLQAAKLEAQNAVITVEVSSAPNAPHPYAGKR